MVSSVDSQAVEQNRTIAQPRLGVTNDTLAPLNTSDGVWADPGADDAVVKDVLTGAVGADRDEG